MQSVLKLLPRARMKVSTSSYLNRTRAALVACTAIVLFPISAGALSYWDAVTDNAVIVADTALLNLTARQERDMINANWDEWRSQKQQAGINNAGQDGINGLFPVREYSLADLGRVEMLTYFFIDTATGLPSSSSPFSVSSVRYDALLNPQLIGTPSESTIRANLTTLGTSSDAASGFVLPFTLTGFEPIVLAFPLDAQGNEIRPPTGQTDFGTAAFVNYVLAPEPASFAILGLALAGLGLARRRPAAR